MKMTVVTAKQSTLEERKLLIGKASNSQKDQSNYTLFQDF